jgi:hypothetical protein
LLSRPLRLPHSAVKTVEAPDSLSVAAGRISFQRRQVEIDLRLMYFPPSEMVESWWRSSNPLPSTLAQSGITHPRPQTCFEVRTMTHLLVFDSDVSLHMVLCALRRCHHLPLSLLQSALPIRPRARELEPTPYRPRVLKN